MAPPELYLKRAGAILGPFGPDDMKRMARVGQIRPNDRISKDQAKWHQAGNVPGLFPEQQAQASEVKASQPAEVQPVAKSESDTGQTVKTAEAVPAPSAAVAQPAPAPAAEIPEAAPELPPMAQPIAAAPVQPAMVPQAAPWPAPAAGVPSAQPARPAAAAVLQHPVSPQVREALIRAIFLIDTGRTVEAADLLRQLMLTGSAKSMATGGPMPASLQPSPQPYASAPVPGWNPDPISADQAAWEPSASDTVVVEDDGIDIDVLHEPESFRYDPSESDIELGTFLDDMSTRSPRRRRR